MKKAKAGAVSAAPVKGYFYYSDGTSEECGVRGPENQEKWRKWNDMKQVRYIDRDNGLEIVKVKHVMDDGSADVLYDSSKW